MSKRKEFIKIFRKAEEKYLNNKKRLAAEGWSAPWQTLIATIMSAQSRDETTIPIAEDLFKKYNNLEKLGNAKYKDVIKIFKSLNYNKTKAKNVIETAKILYQEFKSKVPDTLDELIKLPGVGRKTANLILAEVHKTDAICIDTHCHRLANVLELVKTKTPHQTELALQKIAPKQYWSRINRLFVLWGKDVPGRDKEKLLNKLNNQLQFIS